MTDLDKEELESIIAHRDADELSGRAERLAELNATLPQGEVGLVGQASQWLFEDVKATWIYGYFASTVLTAAAFCRNQLASIIRLSVGDPPMEAGASLEDLARHVHEGGLVDGELLARLISLQDRASLYDETNLDEQDRRMEHHLDEARILGADTPLLDDARMALQACIGVLLSRQ